VQRHEALLAKADNPQYNPSAQPKAWFTDPFSVLDSVGMNYRHNPSALTYETLRLTSERSSMIAAIIITRVNQVAAFCRPQPDKYSTGFKIRPRGGDKKRRLTAGEKDRSHKLEHFILNTGVDYNPGRDGFEIFMRKSTRDRLTYDQVGWEKTHTLSRRLHSFYCLPGETLRLARPTNEKGTPPEQWELKRQIKYAQVINGLVRASYTQDELGFLIANPRTSIRANGYGFPEIEMLMTTITAHLWAEEWNKRAFSQGSTVKGVINMKGNIPQQQFDSFKRQWAAQVSGISNAWKTPLVNTDGIEWIPLQLSNTEMGYQLWLEYLLKVICAIFQIDPAEVNFDLRGGAMQQPVFMSTNEAQQKVSKDRGLQPLLRFFEDAINRHFIWAIDPEFELAFCGLDAKTEEQMMQLRMNQVANIYTLNEIRAMEDLPPVKSGDIVLNAVYSSALQQAQAQEQQQQGQPGQPQPGPEEGGPQQPYQNQFGQPGEDERQGADRLRQFAEQQPKPTYAEEAPSSDNESPAQPWDQRFQKSLSKAEESYILIDCD
jgi:hypothetical protein